MSDLTDDDGSGCDGEVRDGLFGRWVRTAETGLLGVVADEFDTFGFVLDDVGCDGWVVGDLFDEKSCATAVVLVWPVAVEESGRQEISTSGGDEGGVAYSPRTGLRGLDDS